MHVADRNQLLRDLIADMGSNSDHGVEAAWMQKARQRYKELQNGEKSLCLPKMLLGKPSYVEK